MKIEFVPADNAAMLRQIADEFMEEILELRPGSHVISDESDLRDFTEFGVSDTLPFCHRIRAVYAIDQVDVGSERLLDIFVAIGRCRNHQ